MNPYNKLYFILLLVTLISYLSVSRKEEYYQRIVIIYLILLLLTDVASVYLVKVVGLRNNLFLFHLSTPLDYTLLALLYRSVIINRTVKKILTISIPVFIGLSIFLSIFVQKINENNSYAIVAESLLMIFLSLFYLREVLLFQQATVLLRFPLFWISVGVLFFFIGSLLIEGMLNYLMSKSMDLARRAFRIGYIFKYLLCILFIIGAFCNSGRVNEDRHK